MGVALSFVIRYFVIKEVGSKKTVAHGRIEKKYFLKVIFLISITFKFT